MVLLLLLFYYYYFIYFIIILLLLLFYFYYYFIFILLLFFIISINVQSSFELSLSKATYFATCLHQISSVTELRVSRHTCFLCILHDRYLVAIALESLEKKKSIHWTITPSPTLPCLPSARLAGHS